MIHPDFSPKIYTAGTIIAQILFAILLGVYILIAILLLYYKTLSPLAKELWYLKGLLRDIDTSHVSKYIYYIIYLMKKTIFAFTFAFAHDWGLVPFNIIAVFVIFLPLMYLAYVRPFTHRLTNIHMIYNEMNELLITSMMFNYFDPHLTDWEFYMYARITVIDIAVWVVVSYIIYILSLPRFCRIKCPKRKPKLYLPEYEEEIQQELDSPLSSEHDFVIEAAHVDVKEANRRLDSFSSDENDEAEREVVDDDLDEELEDLEREDNAAD
mmetsp:Transcript_37333/g.36930  ORF Transcript_37333/g.36930 Transcript_37333/m.36930 type:complete len:268 (+) Transcript_37333:1945-2748(+)